MHINLRLSMDRFPFDCPLQIGERLGHEGAFSGNSHKRHAVPFSETGTGAGSCCTHGGSKFPNFALLRFDFIDRLEMANDGNFRSHHSIS